MAEMIIDSEVLSIQDDYNRLRNFEATERARFEIELEERKREQVLALGKAMFEAKERGVSVTRLARAVTPVTSATPNRNRVYELIKTYLATGDAYTDRVYPFAWAFSDLLDVNGESHSVPVLKAKFENYGPTGLTGEFEWFLVAGEYSPVSDSDIPFPSDPWYRNQLAHWIQENPTPSLS